jgi:hypothetical protein
MVLYGVLEGMWIINQPYLHSLNIPIPYFGLIFFLVMISTGLFSKYAHKIEKKFGLRKLMVLMILIPAITYVLMASFDYLWLALMIIIPSSIWGLNMVVVDGYLNRRVKSSHRATLISLKNFSGQLLFVFYAPFLGLIIDVWSLTTAISLSATILFLDLAVLLYFLKNRDF